MRIFLAVCFDPSARCALVKARDDFVIERGEPRWVPDRNLHLTLRFLGDRAAPEVSRVTEAVRHTTSRSTTFELSLRGLGSFPEGRRDRARVLWVGVHALPLIGLARELDAALAAQGFPREDRPYSPHITLGRGRSARGLSWRPRQPVEEQIARVAVRELVLVESQLRRDGPEYRRIEGFPLRAPAGSPD